MRRLSTDDRRARLALRHRLAPRARARSFAEVAEGLAGVHATDPASMALAVRARMDDPGLERLEPALYVERSAARVLGMRRTVFAEPIALVPVVHAACSRPLVPAERRRLVAMVETAGIVKHGERWIRRAERAALEALEARGRPPPRSSPRT